MTYEVERWRGIQINHSDSWDEALNIKKTDFMHNLQPENWNKKKLELI